MFSRLYRAHTRLFRLIKGTVSRDFLLLGFFHESVSPKPLSIPLGPFRIFSKISRRYSQLKVDHRYQWHRWQICHQFY